MLCAVADDDLGSAIIELVVGGQFFRNSLAQFRNSSTGRIFCKSGLQCFDRGLFDVFGGVEIRFARAETANIDAFGLHGFGLAVDRERERRSELGGAFGNFHGNRTSCEVVQNGSASYWRR